jgi:phosphatidylinositol kinase/protein kinase (PI-3  family)
MVEAMGVNGTEGESNVICHLYPGHGVLTTPGVFRNAAEISLEILRTNSESLMTVLEAFVHDPLVEWTKVSHGGMRYSRKLIKSETKERVGRQGSRREKSRPNQEKAGWPDSRKGDRQDDDGS